MRACSGAGGGARARTSPAVTSTAFPSSRNPVRISGPFTSSMMGTSTCASVARTISSAARTARSIIRKRSWSPCAQLMRAMFMPQRIMSASVSTAQHAGPTVQMTCGRAGRVSALRLAPARAQRGVHTFDRRDLGSAAGPSTLSNLHAAPARVHLTPSPRAHIHTPRAPPPHPIPLPRRCTDITPARWYTARAGGSFAPKAVFFKCILEWLTT